MREARAGNLWGLIGRILAVPDRYLSDDERMFLRALLERSNGRLGKAELRRIERFLVRSQVESRVAEGEKLEAAVAHVKEHRKRSRTFVFDTLRESKKPK
jgi:hypothetical protein